MDKTLDFIAGMLNQVVGRKGCGYLKDECYDIIDSNRFLWEKAVWYRILHGKRKSHVRQRLGKAYQ